MGFTPPNHRGAVGHSSKPSGPSGRGAQPTGDRFDRPDPTADWPAAPTAPGSGSVPVEPFGPSGSPRSASGLPDDAAQYRRGR